MRADIKPTGHLGIDGAWSDNPQWKGRHVESDPDGKQTVYDYGDAFNGTLFDYHVGLGDGELYQNTSGELIYNKSSLCSSTSFCQVQILCCHGQNLIQVHTVPGQPEANRRCIFGN